MSDRQCFPASDLNYYTPSLPGSQTLLPFWGDVKDVPASPPQKANAELMISKVLQKHLIWGKATLF